MSNISAVRQNSHFQMSLFFFADTNNSQPPFLFPIPYDIIHDMLFTNCKDMVFVSRFSSIFSHEMTFIEGEDLSFTY